MTTIIEIPTLRTPRLVLRSFRMADWDAYAAMESKPAVRAYRGGNLYDRAEAFTAMQRLIGQWALRGYGVFAAERIDSGIFVGFAGVLHPAEWPEPELAYSLDEPFWHQGLATEAARAARDWMFGRFPVPRLVSFIMRENEPSQRVAARLGAVRDGGVVWRGIAAERWVHPAPGAGVQV